MSLQNINLGTGPNTDTGDDARTAGAKINANFQYLLTLINANNSAVENEYLNISELILAANQSNQTTGKFQFVQDASADPNVTEGFAYYEKLAGSTETLADDYRLLSDAEVADLVTDYKTALLEKSTSDITETDGIAFKYTGSSIDYIVFNQKFSYIVKQYAADIGASNLRIKLFNKTQTTEPIFLQVETIAQIAATDYYKATFAANTKATFFDANDIIDVYFDEVGSGSANIYYTSVEGAVSDADISLGSTTFGTDNLTVLQGILDEAQTRPITVIWDGKYSVSGALEVYSNTTIKGIKGCGIILRNASNSPVFQNANRVLPSATGGYGSNIVDENIRIENLIINGNGYNTGTGGDTVFDTANNGSAVNGSAQTKRIPIIDFLGAKEVYLSDIKLWAGRYWATSFCNIEQLHCTNLDIDFGLSSTRDDANYDGLHFNGYARWISCKGLRLKGTKDDCLAINADANPTLYPSYSGDILDAVFEDVYFNDAVRGIRLQSSTSRLDRITFNNIYGETTDAICLIENLWGTNYGDIGNITFENINVILTNDSYYSADAYFYISNQTVESLVLNNVGRSDFTYAVPLFYITSSNTSVGNLMINNVNYNSSGGTFNKSIVEITNGTVDNILVNNCVHTEATSKINAEIIKQSGGTVNNVILDNIVTSNISKLVNHTGGTLTAIKATNITHTGDTDETFVTTGTIANLNLSNYRSVGDIFSGTFTNKWGDGFTYAPVTAANLPDASQYQFCPLVIDESVAVFSDGTDWKSVIDGTTVEGASVPTANIVSYWNFDSNSNDQVGTNNGTDTNVSYVTGGKVSNKLDLTSNSDSRVLVADSADLSFGDGSTDSAFSLSMWVEWNSKASSHQIVGKRLYADNSNKEYHVFYNIGGSIAFRLFDQSAGSYIETVYTLDPTLNQLYHIVTTYDGSGLSSGLTIYVDKVSGGTPATSGTYTAMENGTGEFIIGPAVSGGTGLDGYVDELVPFNKKLTSNEVIACYNKGAAGTAINV